MSRSIVEVIEKRARKNHAHIAIGIGAQNSDVIDNVSEALKHVDFADVSVVDSEKKLINLLGTGEVDAVVRGSLASSGVLQEVRRQLRPKKTGRIALLETSSGFPFFFAPVGIDEGNKVPERIFLIREGIKLTKRLNVDLKIGVLAGGRKSDLGRHKNVDKSLMEAQQIVDEIKKEGFQEISNYSILVEEAIEEGSNFIIAPNGITGNLMFRTLAFLGGGRGYGAPMVGIDKVYVDTSRASSSQDYYFALMIAGALVD
jgi:putative methanogen marker protein 4